MATPRAESYAAASGAGVYGGRTADVVRATPDAAGGTVTQLLAGWSGTGFQRLTTAPALYNSSAHSGAVMDNAAGIVWIFGAETHAGSNGQTGMDNSVFRFDIADGLFKRQYPRDTWRGDYRIGADGILYANAAKTRPWAMHTYRRMRYIPATEEIEVIYDAFEHSYWSIAPLPIQEGAIAPVDNVSAFWYFNVRSGTWRADPAGQRSQMSRAAFAHGTCFVPGFGWYALDGSFLYRLTEAGVYSTTPVAGLVNGKIHSALYHWDGELIKIGGEPASGTLYSRTPLGNPALSSKFDVSAYAALAGHSMENTASVQMPDGRYLLFPTRTADNQLRPMVLDVGANTVTPTGHALTVDAGRITSLSFRAVWSVAHNCVLWITGKEDGTVRAYAYRMP